MKINELVEFVEGNKVLSDTQLRTTLAKKLEVKDYVPIKEKKQVIGDIINQSILFSDGVFKFDEIKKYVCFTMKSIELYTNIELSDDIENDYDEFASARLLSDVISLFKSEHDDLNIFLSLECDSILLNNSVEAQVGRLIDSISANIDDITYTIKNGLDKLDIGPDMLKDLDLGAIKSFVNRLK